MTLLFTRSKALGKINLSSSLAQIYWIILKLCVSAYKSVIFREIWKASVYKLLGPYKFFFTEKFIWK